MCPKVKKKDKPVFMNIRDYEIIRTDELQNVRKFKIVLTEMDDNRWEIKFVFPSVSESDIVRNVSLRIYNFNK